MIVSYCAIKTGLFLVASAGQNHILCSTELVFDVQSCCSGSGSGNSPVWVCRGHGIKACPDPITARQEWSWFCSMGVAVLWPGPCSGLEPSTQGPLQLDSTVVVCEDFSLLFKSSQEALFTEWSNECEALHCLLMPEDITHLIFPFLAERERLQELNLFNPPFSNRICFYIIELGTQEFLKLAESIALISCLKCWPLSPPQPCTFEVCADWGQAELDAVFLSLEYLPGLVFLTSPFSVLLSFLTALFGMLMPVVLELFTTITVL